MLDLRLAPGAVEDRNVLERGPLVRDVFGAMARGFLQRVQAVNGLFFAAALVVMADDVAALCGFCHRFPPRLLHWKRSGRGTGSAPRQPGTIRSVTRPSAATETARSRKGGGCRRCRSAAPRPRDARREAPRAE